MLSKEAEQSIKRFKSFSVFMSSMYESPGNMSKSKRRFFRWFLGRFLGRFLRWFFR